MNDLTIIFLTVNKVPKKWAEYQKSVLLEAVGSTSIITVSKEPLDWGLNIIQEGEICVESIYREVLRAAKLATTPYIAIAEDDTLYSKDHFEFRPPMDTYAYNMNRWGLFTWGDPTYYHKDRISNATLIAPREMVIESLEERFRLCEGSRLERLGELGKEKGTNLNRRKTITFYSLTPIIFLSHVEALDRLERTKRKRMGFVRAFDIPYWGHCKQLIKHFV